MKIDKKATAQNAREFLQNDCQFYFDRCGLKYDEKHDGLKDYQYTDNPNDRIIKSVMQDIYNCEPKSRQILLASYFGHYHNREIAQQMGYSLSRFKDLKQDALCEFANRLDYWCMKNDVVVTPLYVYK